MRFHVLGELQMSASRGPVELGGPRQRAVLAALLFRAGEAVSVGHLTEAVWERPPATPESTLRTYIAGIRAQLAAAGAPAERLATRTGGYRLDVEPGELDLHTFTRGIEEAHDALARGEPAAADRAFTRALRWWRGQPLAGIRNGPALDAEIAGLDEMRLHACEQHVQVRIQLGRHAEVVAQLRRLVAEHPLREELTAQLMLALCRSGRQAEALQAFTATRRRLAAELGLDPGARLRAMHQQILRGSPEIHEAPVGAAPATRAER